MEILGRSVNLVFKEWALLLLQLLAIGLFSFHFNIEVQFNLPRLFVYICFAFIIHSLFPIQYRKWVFLSATILGILLIVSVLEAFVLISLSLILVGICNLNCSISFRKILVLAVASVLGYLRYTNAISWISSQVLIILTSMFMFRIMLLLFELKFRSERIPLLTQLTYFLMPPNLVFPLFPIVDLKLFEKNYYDIAPVSIYRRGVCLITRGVLQLFVYRVVYYFLQPSLNEVSDLLDLFNYFVFTYLLIFRLIGLFNFSIGVLCLFGYNLPEPFKNPFISNGFNDLWRRINVYWKDFIAKLFFNPLYFRLRRIGNKSAIVLSTIISFAITLFLHALQYFWLVGTIELTFNDLVFWGFFAFVISLRTIFSFQFRWKNPLLKFSGESLSISFTFLSICILWSYWTAKDLGVWVDKVMIASHATIAEWLSLTTILIVAVIFLSLYLYILKKGLLARKGNLLSTVRSAPIFSLLLLLMTFNSLTIDRYWSNVWGGNTIDSIFNSNLKSSDMEEQLAGYYDNALSNYDVRNSNISASHVASQMFQTMLFEKGILKNEDNELGKSLVPNSSAIIQGVEVSINDLGIRDEVYSVVPESDVDRIVFIGASPEMGWMLSKEDSFEEILEARLNSRSNSIDHKKHVEIINYSIPGRIVLNHMFAAEEILTKNKPQETFFFDHQGAEWIRIKQEILRYNFSTSMEAYSMNLASNIDLAFNTQNEDILEPIKTEIFEVIYKRLFDLCIENGTRPTLVVMPEFFRGVNDASANQFKIAKAVGFRIIDLRDEFKLDEIPQYILDHIGHPNIEANKRIAERLYDELTSGQNQMDF